MKRLTFITIFILSLISVLSGQTLQKGNLVGIHELTVDLKPDVTLEQFQEFYISKVIPALETNLVNWKFYLSKELKAENSNSLGLIVVIKSKEYHKKYYNDDGSFTELGKSCSEKLTPVFEELYKLGTYQETYTDWLVQ